MSRNGEGDSRKKPSASRHGRNVCLGRACDRSQMRFESAKNSGKSRTPYLLNRSSRGGKRRRVRRAAIGGVDVPRARLVPKFRTSLVVRGLRTHAGEDDLVYGVVLFPQLPRPGHPAILVLLVTRRGPGQGGGVWLARRRQRRPPAEVRGRGAAAPTRAAARARGPLNGRPLRLRKEGRRSDA